MMNLCTSFLYISIIVISVQNTEIQPDALHVSSPVSGFSNQAKLLITCGFVAVAAVGDINKAMLIELSSLCHLLSRICLQEDN